MDIAQLATQSNNIVFAKVGEPDIPEYALKLAPLRTYLVEYQKNKFYFWSSFVIVLVILTMSFKKGQGTITYPATAGALLGAIKVSLVSPSSLGVIGGFIGGLMIGTVIYIFSCTIWRCWLILSTESGNKYKWSYN